MFDAKSLLEMIARSAAPGPGGTQAQSSNPLEDLLRQFNPDGQTQAASGSATTPGGGLGDILGQLQKSAGASGGIMDVLGKALGQATSGVKEGAQQIDKSTGGTDKLRQIVEQLSGGQTPEELIERAKKMIAENQFGAGAALGGLGALILGTRTGRGLAIGAAKLGALALIGGLAYKAYQNYSQGKPLLGDGNSDTSAFASDVAPAPDGTGFEPDAISNETAALLIRAMLASAAADGRVDASEEQKIIGSLSQAGLGQEAESFIQNALRNPATPAELAAAVRTPEEALQVFTAARIAVDIDTVEERTFLAELAAALKLDPSLIAHIDAGARAVV